MGWGRSSEDDPLPHVRAPEPGGGWGLDPPPGSASPPQAVCGSRPCAQLPSQLLRRRRRAAPGGVAWPPWSTGGSALAASSRRESAGGERSSAASVRARAGARERRASSVARSLELAARRTALADEVGVIGVREPVRLGPQAGDERLLLHDENDLGRRRRRRGSLDRLAALRVGGGVRRAGRRPRRRAPRRRTRRADEGCAGVVGARTSRCGDRGPPGSRPRGTHRAGTPTGSTAGPRRARAAARAAPLGVEDARLEQHVEGVCVLAEVKLIAGLAAERVTLIGANLGLDAQRPQESEGAARDRVRGDVEVEGERATTAQVHRAGGVEDRRGLGQPVAPPRRRDGGQLGANVLGERAVAQSSTPSSARRRRLSATPDGP